MRTFLYISLITLCFACGNRSIKSSFTAASCDSISTGELSLTDSSPYSKVISDINQLFNLDQSLNSNRWFIVKYNKPIENYNVIGLAIKGEDYYNIYFQFEDTTTHKPFYVNAGKENYPDLDNPLLKNGYVHQIEYPQLFKPKGHNIIFSTATEPFFFADLDFDGQNELITGLEPMNGQRYYGTFSAIYQIRFDSVYNATNHFSHICEAFQEIEQNQFIVDYDKKEVIQWLYGGLGIGSDMKYKYDKNTRTYHLDRIIDYDRWVPNAAQTRLIVQGKSIPNLPEEPVQEITIRSPSGKIIRTEFVNGNEWTEQLRWQY